MNKSDLGHKYDDIINLPHHQSATHPHMSLNDRAAQFAPFAALTGHDAAIRETARLTDESMELDESEMELLDERLQWVMERIKEQPEIEVTYFQSDQRKAGGSYRTHRGRVKKIDSFEHSIIFVDGFNVAIKDIIEIMENKN